MSDCRDHGVCTPDPALNTDDANDGPSTDVLKGGDVGGYDDGGGSSGWNPTTPSSRMM